MEPVPHDRPQHGQPYFFPGHGQHTSLAGGGVFIAVSVSDVGEHNQ